MKYFSNLPKRTFSSSIGDFSISDFFSRYEVDNTLAYTQDTIVDDHSTLIELSQHIYADNNSIWLFMLANNYIDPFDLVAHNVTLFEKYVKNQISTGFSDESGSTTEMLNPGAIVAPYGATSGNKWEYSYVGNFSLTGPFALVERTNYYTGKMRIKDQQITAFMFATQPSGLTYDKLSLIDAPGITTTGYTGKPGRYTTKGKLSVLDNVGQIVYKDDGKVIQGNSGVYTTFKASTPTQPPTNTGISTNLSNLDIILGENKNIKVYIPGKLSSVLSNLITFSV